MPIPTTPSIRACISPACCWPSRWQLLAATELKQWRDGLLGTMARPRSTGFAVACAPRWSWRRSTTSASRTGEAWEIGLAGLPDAQEARNVVISDDKVREFVATAYGLDHQFGLLTDTLAITGARPSQAVRLRVEDLHDHPVRPKLMMPKIGQGRRQKPQRRKRPSAIRCRSPSQLAARLKAAAKGRADDAPLLLQSDGSPWDKNPGQNYHRQVDKVVTAIGLDPAEVTMYALRHSSIVRMLLRNVPIRLVASLHNTSVAMIEKHYSRYITEHSIDDITRVGLLSEPVPAAGNVVAMVR